MKHNTLTGTLLPVILILLQACAASKVNSSHQLVSSATGSSDIVTTPAGDAIYRNDIHIRAVRHFKQTFPEAQDERWYIIQNGFMAKYKVGDTQVRLDYDRRGNWLYTIRYLTEKKLPREVRALVKSTWYDHTICSAEEIQTSNQFIYILHLNQGDDWKLIRVADGEMSEIIPPGKGE
ncbi:hypothetical protein [Paraflavitalea speifideaquila]|uniref:hypothetical protein n=1 Tax=Paraflavitalea speifideaquila TaxID=3076558 RepID=UPI0028E5BDA6|nr:hypothetical protein [Paraflavitalea speifideiaquila]